MVVLHCGSTGIHNTVKVLTKTVLVPILNNYRYDDRQRFSEDRDIFVSRQVYLLMGGVVYVSRYEAVLRRLFNY